MWGHDETLPRGTILVAKRFCSRGHDTEIVGRTPNDLKCRVCKREQESTPKYLARKRERQRTPEYRAVALKREHLPETRAKRREARRMPDYLAKQLVSVQRYKATPKGSRMNLFCGMRKLRKAHLTAEQNLEFIFAEVNEVLAG